MLFKVLDSFKLAYNSLALTHFVDLLLLGVYLGKCGEKQMYFGIWISKCTYIYFVIIMDVISYQIFRSITI